MLPSLYFDLKSIFLVTILFLVSCDFIDSKEAAIESSPNNFNRKYSQTSKKNQFNQALYQGKMNQAKQVLVDAQKERLHAKYSSTQDQCFKISSLVYEEKWKKVVEIERPVSKTPSCIIISHLAKGAAYAASGNFLSARSEIKALNSLKKTFKKSPEKTYLSYSSYFLIGFLRFQQKKYSDTIRILKRAYKIEEKFPRHNHFSWVFNSLYYIGLGYEATGRPQAAAKFYRRMLRRWPNMARAEKRLESIRRKAKG